MGSMNMTVMYDDNSSDKGEVSRVSTIGDIADELSRGNEGELFELHAYSVTLRRDENAWTTLQSNPIKTIFASFKNVTHPSARDIAMAEEDLKKERCINMIIGKHWQCFNHTTTSLYGFIVEDLAKNNLM